MKNADRNWIQVQQTVSKVNESYETVLKGTLQIYIKMYDVGPFAVSLKQFANLKTSITYFLFHALNLNFSLAALATAQKPSSDS